MSFYFDDDDDDDGGGGYAPRASQVCANCGESNFYTDSSGTLICSVCLTQSQDQSQQHVIDENYMLGNGRNILFHPDLGKRLRPTNEEMDQSSKLPSLERCLEGFQVALRCAARRAADLAGLAVVAGGGEESKDEKEDEKDEDEEEETDGRGRGDTKRSTRDDGAEAGRKLMEDTVRDIWFGYLRSWRDGADAFGALFPELRFSLRDAFIGKSLRNMIWRHLSAQATRKIEEEWGLKPGEFACSDADAKGKPRGTPTPTPTPTPRDRHRAKRKRSSSPTQPSGGGNGTASGRNPLRLPPFARVNRMLNALPYLRCRTPGPDSPVQYPPGALVVDRFRAALRLAPSLSLLTSIVYLALLKLRAGVASYHLVRWAEDWAFPFAYDAWTCLPPNLREDLMIVRPFFFRCSRSKSSMGEILPRPSILDHHADLLAVACDFGWARAGVTYPSTWRPSAKDKTRQRRHIFWPEPGLNGADRECGAAFYSDNVPLLAARMVADLGLEQRVLDVALALMGLYTPPIGDGSGADQSAADRDARISKVASSGENARKGFRATSGDTSRSHDRADSRENNVAPEDGRKAKRPWLPAPLKSASPEMLHSPLHVMAVLTVAIRMCPGWENWGVLRLDASSSTVHLKKAAGLSTAKVTNEGRISYGHYQDGRNSINSNDSDSDAGHSSKCSNSSFSLEKGFGGGRTTGIKQPHLIPWNESRLSLLTYGPSLDAYVRFLEETFLADRKGNDPHNEFIEGLQEYFAKYGAKRGSGENHQRSIRSTSADNRKHDSVRPHPLLVGGRPPCGFLSLSTVSNNAMDIGRYILYEIPERLRGRRSLAAGYAEHLPFLLNRRRRLFHPEYVALVEACAACCGGADPADLHELVEKLETDIELVAYSCGALHEDWYGQTEILVGSSISELLLLKDGSGCFDALSLSPKRNIS